MKNDNRGFTLVELMISLVIFGVVVISAFGFMLAASHSYNSVTNRVNLEVQSQLAMNQIENYITDCNTGLYYDGVNKLYIVNKGSTSAKYDVHVFQFTGSSIYYGYGKDAATLSGSAFSCSVAANDLLVKNVTGFSFTASDGTALAPDAGAALTSASVELEFTRASATYGASRTLALRNKPILAEKG